MADEDPANGNSPHRDSDKSGESPGTLSEALVEEITQKVLATIKKKSPTSQDKTPSTGDSTSRDHSGGADASTLGTSRADALADEITRKVVTAIQKKTSTPQGEEFPPCSTQQGCDRPAGVISVGGASRQVPTAPPLAGVTLWGAGPPLPGASTPPCLTPINTRGLRHWVLGPLMPGPSMALCLGPANARGKHPAVPCARHRQGQAPCCALYPSPTGASTLRCLVPSNTRGKHSAVPCAPLMPGASALLCLVSVTDRGKHSAVPRTQ